MTATTLVTRTVAGTSLPLAYQVVPKLFKSVTVAQLTVPDLAVGDLVHVTGRGQVEILADGPDRAMHCSYLKVTKTGNNASTEGLLLDRPMGNNFTKAQHYGLQNVAGSFIAGDPWTGDVTVQMVMYAANLSQQPDDPRSLAVKYVELRADTLHLT